jgi:hypothetical protein
MKILIYDQMIEASGAPVEIISPGLADIYIGALPFTITLAAYGKINCIGVGYTDATEISVSNGVDTRTVTIDKVYPYHNGLWLIQEIYPLDTEYPIFYISHNGTFIGRIGIGIYRTLGTNPTKEIGFYDTEDNRETLSGQVIPGAGGYSGRRFEADVRYKIDSSIYNDFEKAYPGQIAKGFPYFMLLDDEQHKLPANILHFYAQDKGKGLLLQSSTYKFLYSYKFSFYEKF